jgi:uncharacterized protein with FMN-binding domain
MKKFLVSFLFVSAFVIEVIYQNPVNPQISANPVVSSTPAVSNNPIAVPTPIKPVSAPGGQYRDGTYSGSAVDAYYGTVQVQAIISGSRIADVRFLSYPNDRMHSVQVNQYAMPILTQEAIQVQNAQVNAVSGASYTSAAFVESLAAALSQAKN